MTGDSGYHNVDAQGPFGRVFVKTATEVKQKWTVVASHELLEMLINPYANLASFVPSDETGNVGVYYDLEVCDPVYLDELSYSVKNVSVWICLSRMVCTLGSATRSKQAVPSGGLRKEIGRPDENSAWGNRLRF